MRVVRTSSSQLRIEEVVFHRVERYRSSDRTVIEVYQYREARFVVKHYASQRRFHHERGIAERLAGADPGVFLPAHPVVGADLQLALPYHPPLSRHLEEAAPNGLSFRESLALVATLAGQIRRAREGPGCIYTDVKLDNILLVDGDLARPVFTDLAGWWFPEGEHDPEYTLWTEERNPGSERYCAFCLTIVLTQLWSRTRFLPLAILSASRRVWKDGKPFRYRDRYLEKIRAVAGPRFVAESAAPDTAVAAGGGQMTFLHAELSGKQGREFDLLRELLRAESLRDWLQSAESLERLPLENRSEQSQGGSNVKGRV